MNKEMEFDNIIQPRSSLLDLRLQEVARYRDLLMLFVKRNVVLTYKQTILGPLWFFIQPILTTLVFTIVFGNIAGIATDGIPQPLFYMAGIVIWNFFAECFTSTSSIFSSNADIFGKVYFPRLITPLAVVISNGLKFLIQFCLFFVLYVYFMVKGSAVEPNSYIFLFPLLILLMAILGLGFGLVFSSLTTKYRDLNFLIQFGVQLLMYATPIIYPISEIPSNYRILIWINPLSHIIETFKYAFLGQGTFSISGLIYSGIFALVILLLGIIIFNRTEKTFMDTV
jgi:lipopolysaccharide transport system permease protein